MLRADRPAACGAGGRRFVVKPGHEIPDVETIVERRESYIIVEKPAEATDLARHSL